MVTTTSTEVFDVEIGRLRKDGGGTAELFEAIRVAQTLGHDMSVSLDSDPIPPPSGEEHEYQRKAREENSAVLIFYAERGDS